MPDDVRPVVRLTRLAAISRRKVRTSFHERATCLSVDRLRVGVVGGEVEGHGAEDAQLGGHLLHPPQPPLLLRVGELHHQTGRRSLARKRVAVSVRLVIDMIFTSMNGIHYHEHTCYFSRPLHNSGANK